MSVSNATTINTLITNSGLQGQALADYKARLESMSAEELQAELSQKINGAQQDNIDVAEFTTPSQQVPNLTPAQMQEISETQAKEITIGLIDENLTEAEELFDSQHLGAITGAYDKGKKDDDKLKTDNVRKILDYQKAGEIQLVEAKNGKLTRRAYYEENKQRIKDMLLTRLNVLKSSTGIPLIDLYRDSYSKEEIAQFINKFIDDLLRGAELDKLKDMQRQIVSFSPAEEPEALKNIVDKAIYHHKVNDVSESQSGEVKTLSLSLKKDAIPTYWDSAEIISFEEVYKYERGTEYSEPKVREYIQANAEMQTVVNAFNKKQEFVEFTTNLAQDNIPAEVKAQKIMEGFANFYSLSDDGGKEQLLKLIEKSNLPITLDENGINLSAFQVHDETGKHNALNRLLKLAAQEKEKDFKAFLGDKTIEDYQLAMEQARDNILGEENSRMLTEAMLQDNDVIKRFSGDMGNAGMLAMAGGGALCIIGGVLCVTGVGAGAGAGLIAAGGKVIALGNGLAMTGMVARNTLGAVDYATKDVQTTEEAANLAKDFIMDAGGFIIGFKAGKAGNAAFKQLINKKLGAVLGEQMVNGNTAQALKTVFSNPEYLKSFATAAGAKLSTDFIISYAGDLAMMGVLDTKDDWKSLLQANLTGLIVGTSSDIKHFTGRLRSEPANQRSTTVDMNSLRVMNSSDITAMKVQGRQVYIQDGIVYERDANNKPVAIGRSDSGAQINHILAEDEGIPRTENVTEPRDDAEPDNKPDVPIRELSDAEFEAMKTEIESKLKEKKVFYKSLNKYNIQLANKILSDKKLGAAESILMGVLWDVKSAEDANLRYNLVKKICSDEKLYGNKNILNCVNNILANIKTPEQFKLIDRLLADEKLQGNEEVMNKVRDIIISAKDEEKAKLVDRILSDEKLYSNENVMNKASDIILSTRNPEIAKLADKILSDEKLYSNEILMFYIDSFLKHADNPERAKIIDKVLSDERLYGNGNFMNSLGFILSRTDDPESTKAKCDVISKLLSDERIYGNENFMNEVWVGLQFLSDAENAKVKCDLIDKILSDERLYDNDEFMKKACRIFNNTCNAENAKIADIILSDERLFNNEEFMNSVPSIIYATNKRNFTLAEQLCTDKELNIDPKRIPILLKQDSEISEKEVKKLYKTLGRRQVAELSDADFVMAARFIDLYGKTNINEIPISAKRKVLRQLVAANADLFSASSKIKEMFPLLPKDAESYCALLPALVRSTGVETNPLKPEQVNKFNTDLQDLSDSLAKLDDTEFSQLEISQEYSTKDLTLTVLEKLKDLSPAERQKVFDYFGFELHRNKNNETGYSIVGYPVNLNNGKKLAQISDPKTQAVVESLRGDVLRFSEQNPVRCNNAQVEHLLNEIVEVLPELRTTISRSQHGSQDFDIMQHSLKVMQKISQDPKFAELGESDKKIMMIAALMHDITKLEGFIDKTHADNGSFDSFFIAKKFNLSKEEEIKLYTLIRNHEWLEKVNTSGSEEILTKRLQDIAYDLRHDNLFEMALMFTHADLRAVKADDSFHDTTVGRSRVDFNGNVRSFGESADVYAERIRGYIDELRTSQPLLPVTKFPAASDISRRITQVNPDGSTNIKGVYKNKDGLVIVKYNEVEDWEALGFPKGTDSRGVMAKGVNGAGEECDVETGNIKFFVHGLDFENQLTKFDAFGLIDSDALLSVSYAERPESKYGFFRPQGVILDVDTKYVHGGGNTDSGSGCGKSIQDFKDDYIFGGVRESDRLYVSNMIKEATGMNDAEYVEFVKANENKSMLEIEPADVREKIIKAFATINSNTRKGNREYNEMYASNPRVMGVFAYPASRQVGNIMEFVENQESFLREYALRENLPFIVFGD